MQKQPHDKTAGDMAWIARLSERFAARREKCQAWLAARPALRLCYLVGVCIVGVLVLIAGILMLVLPGPGWLTIFLGLAILGSEFHWAKRSLDWLRGQVNYWLHRWQAYMARRRQEKANKQ